MRRFAATVSMLSGMLLVIAGCSSLPVLPDEPLRVATREQARTLMGEVFDCTRENRVPSIGLGGDNLEDFRKINAQGMVLFAITEDDFYVWVSPDGQRALYAYVEDVNEPLGGGLMAGCYGSIAERILDEVFHL